MGKDYGLMEEKGNMDGHAVLEVEVALEQAHLEYLVEVGLLSLEDMDDSAAIGRAVSAWLKSLTMN
jgi:hypothetical protein